MQVFTCLWNLTLLGSSNFLFIDPYDTLIQSHACSNSRTWMNLFWKQNMTTLMLNHHKCHIHIWEVALMISHSYLVHFELVQTCCLSSYAMHTLYFDHTHTRHQPLSIMNNLAKARHPPETKRKQVCLMLMNPCSSKKKEKGEGL